MADPVTQATPAAPGAAAPASPAAVEAPAVASPQPAAPAAPAAETAAPAAPAAPESPHARPTLLEQFDADAAASAKAAVDKAAAETGTKAAEPAKPAEPAAPAVEKVDAVAAAKETKPAAEAKPVEAAKPAEAVKPAVPAAAPEPIKYDFKMPETMAGTKADDPGIQAFTGVLNEAKAPPEVGQKLLDMHADRMMAFAQQMRDEQFKVFNQTREDWAKEVKSDPEIGGAGYQTAMGAIARMRDLFVSSHPTTSPEYQKDRASFEQFLRVTGAGDHPAFLRFAHNVAASFDEPALPPPGAKPVANNGQAPGGRRGKVLYDNPRSSQNRQ